MAVRSLRCRERDLSRPSSRVRAARKSAAGQGPARPSSFMTASLPRPEPCDPAALPFRPGTRARTRSGCRSIHHSTSTPHGVSNQQRRETSAVAQADSGPPGRYGLPSGVRSTAPHPRHIPQAAGQPPLGPPQSQIMTPQHFFPPLRRAPQRGTSSGRSVSIQLHVRNVAPRGDGLAVLLFHGGRVSAPSSRRQRRSVSPSRQGRSIVDLKRLHPCQLLGRAAAEHRADVGEVV